MEDGAAILFGLPGVAAGLPVSWPVTRAPGGSSAIDSENALRGQRHSRHRYCALRQRTASGASP